MRAHRIERLPVVDKRKLVGIVTKDKLLRALPSPVTSFSRQELTYLLAKLQVKEIMEKSVITTTPNATVEEAITVAQANRVGSLPVLEDYNLVGIVTTNDFFYCILNPLMGVERGGKRIPGARIIIYRCSDTKDIQKTIECISKHNLKIKSMCTVLPEDEENALLIHLDTKDAGEIVVELKKLGYSAELRKL
jgi:acetoin utilization protein AcuB